MSEQFNDKHLLWWVLKAIRIDDGVTLLNPDTWAALDAPDWVLPALREKLKDME